MTLLLCRMLARIVFPFQTSVVPEAGPDYLALHYYAKINPSHANRLAEEWFERQSP